MTRHGLRIAVLDHRGLGRPLVQALFRAGHRAARTDDADVLLLDIDPPRLADVGGPPVFSHRDVIDHYKAHGATVVLYPHGCNPELYYDGLFEPYEHVDARIVHSIGHAEFLRRIECPGQVRVIGWSLCDIAPFRPRQDVRRVLFAPLHPTGTGGDTLTDAHREANIDVYERLLAGGWELTVRTVGTPEQNGLWNADGVTFVTGGTNLGLRDIHAADAVVAGAGTFPALAIARGVPTVMYRHGAGAMYGLPGEQPTRLRRPERYADYIRYPFTVDDGPLDEVIDAAARSEGSLAAWKRRFIGEPFDATAAAAIVEHVVRTPPEQPTLEARRFKVVAFADELLEHPDRLAAYCTAFGPGDDATLVLWAPGLDEREAQALARRAADAAGFEPDGLAHVVAFAHPGIREADSYLAAHADAVFSEWPLVGRLAGLQRFGPSDIDGLRALAARVRN